MKGYIKDPQTFTTVKALDIVSWELPIAATTDEAGTATAYGSQSGFEGYFFLMDGNIYLIQSVAPESNLTTFSLNSIIDFFDRPVTLSGNTYGGILANILTNDYKMQSDPLYRYSYITVTNTDSTACTVSGTHSFKELVRAFANVVEVTIDGNGFELNFTIQTANRPSHTVTFDGSEQLLSQTFSRETVSKVTIGSTSYYLTKGGSITTTRPADNQRVVGEWIVTDSGTAEEVFAKNTASHKIEWMSFDKWGLNDTVRFRINESVYESQITYIGSSSSDTRYKYRSGELATTLTEKIRRMQ
jgi:hypothetical protein